MSLLAYSSAGAINTWGFAYVGRRDRRALQRLAVYVKARVEPQRATSTRVTLGHRIAAIGPIAIAIGGMCGASLGLGFANLLDSQFFEAAEVDDVIDDLCLFRSSPASPLPTTLHDELTTSPATSMRPKRRPLTGHSTWPPTRLSTTGHDWNETIDRLVDELRNASGSDNVGCVSNPGG